MTEVKKHGQPAGRQAPSRAGAAPQIGINRAAALQAHRNVGPLAFSSDGDFLVTAGPEYDVRLWDMRGLNSMLANPVETACGIVGTGLSEQEWARFVPGLPYRETCS